MSMFGVVDVIVNLYIATFRRPCSLLQLMLLLWMLRSLRSRPFRMASSRRAKEGLSDRNLDWRLGEGEGRRRGRRWERDGRRGEGREGKGREIGKEGEGREREGGRERRGGMERLKSHENTDTRLTLHGMQVSSSATRPTWARIPEQGNREEELT